jgi:hypothetical protein
MSAASFSEMQCVYNFVLTPPRSFCCPVLAACVHVPRNGCCLQKQAHPVLPLKIIKLVLYFWASWSCFCILNDDEMPDKIQKLTRPRNTKTFCFRNDIHEDLHETFTRPLRDVSPCISHVPLSTLSVSSLYLVLPSTGRLSVSMPGISEITGAAEDIKRLSCPAKEEKHR